MQALILIDFLLSLAPQAKEKWKDLKTPNRSVQYTFTLGPEDVSFPYSLNCSQDVSEEKSSLAALSLVTQRPLNYLWRYAHALSLACIGCRNNLMLQN